MWDKKLIYDTIWCLILQILVMWLILGIFFDHDMWQALGEALVTQVISTIAGISFLVIMFNKR